MAARTYEATIPKVKVGNAPMHYCIQHFSVAVDYTVIVF